MPLDVTTGMLSATMSLSATGHSPAGLLATLGGAVNATIRHGTLVGVDLPRATEGGGDAPPPLTDASVNAALAEGTMPFDELDVVAQASLGAVRLDQTRLTAPSGTMLVTGTVDLTTAAADLR